MEINVNNNAVNIQLPDENSCEQHRQEIGLFIYRIDDELIRDFLNEIGIEADIIHNYQLFVFLWLMFKQQKKYTHSISFDGLDIWNMRIVFLDNDTVVFVNDKNEVVFTEETYNIIARDIRENYTE